MKKRSLSLFLIGIVLSLMLTGTAALAQESPEAQISAVLTQNGLQSPVQIQTWGNSAACFAEKDGQTALCLLEKRNDSWELVICNQNALRREEQMPTLVLDSDNAVFWTYLFPDKVVRFHAERDNEGRWGRVDETASFARGEVWYTYNVSWSGENGGEICRGAIVEDENGNHLTHESIEYIPASWLGGSIGLGDFDLSRFPSMGFSGDHSDPWPGQQYLSDAAAAMMPQYTCIGGIWQNGHLQFLMEKPDGNRVCVVCSYSDHTPRTVNLSESSVLPKGTYPGVENFSDHLGIERQEGIQAVSIQRFSGHPWNGIRQIWNHNDESPLMFGKNCYIPVWNDKNVIWYGTHPLAPIRIVDWENIPASDAEAKAILNSEEYAVVNNPDPRDRLHLREKPDKDGRSLGKYYNGTPVHVYEIRGDWACVSVGDQDGWMMKKYLTFGQKDQPLLCDTSAMPQLMSVNAYEMKVYPRPEETRYTTDILYINTFSDPAYQTMKIIGIIGDDWYHVWFPENEEYGFIRQSDLWQGNG
ncbi:MAG: SH3 domain-containing protein [Clostridia bacterium]|nr:SH3 domain-containing protein [Clostridia bacterium]